MDKLVFTALNTLSAQRFERQSITNELANLSTVGFKKSYETALETIKVSGSGFDSRFLSRIVEADIINMKPGTPMATGRSLDLMMNDATVLGVQAEDGALAFTRRGDLRINDAGFVETGGGELVLEAGGAPLSVPPGSQVSFWRGWGGLRVRSAHSRSGGRTDWPALSSRQQHGPDSSAQRRSFHALRGR